MKSQVPLEIYITGEGFYRWDVISDYKYILIDTTIDNNIWQIGKPSKSLFSSALSSPNAIITDTSNTYPINNESYFYLKIYVIL